MKQQMIPLQTWLLRGALAASIALLAGCNSDSLSVTANDDGMSVSVPGYLRFVQAVRGNDLQLRISLNGTLVRTVPVTDQDDVQVDLQVPDGQPNDIGLAWYAVIGSNSILLADYLETVADSRDSITVDSYNSTGDGFDFDNDGRTNLVEVRENRNAFDAVDLRVPFSTADFLPANNTIKNEGIDSNTSGDAVEVDLDTTFSIWHNGTDLNLYLCGQDQTLSESSAQYWHDDTVFVFFDGRDSNNATYDGVDDYQIAFVRSTEELIVSKGASNPGCPNGECITYSFFNNSSSCQYELSASFPLASMNMVVGERFGLDVEFTDDDNGGLREDSAAWIGYNDSSDTDPRTFGTALLE